MPKAPSKTRAGTARKGPLAKSTEDPSADPEEKKQAEASEPKAPIKTLKKQATGDKAKNSHLYTDDNPSTTLHGTGFKDHDTATHTIALVSQRSLTYQFQTINTLLHRAKNHPATKKGPNEGNADMRAAIDVFRHWIDETYPAAKAGLRAGGFKPLLSKGRVAMFLYGFSQGEGREFAEMYVKLGRNKRLGNVLVDDSKPGEADWERKRYDALCDLVPEGKETLAAWSDDELFEDGQASKQHLELIAWAWSPVPDRNLPNAKMALI